MDLFDKMNLNNTMDHLYSLMDNAANRMDAMLNDKNDVVSHQNRTMKNDDSHHHSSVLYFHCLTEEHFHRNLPKKHDQNSEKAMCFNRFTIG